MNLQLQDLWEAAPWKNLDGCCCRILVTSTARHCIPLRPLHVTHSVGSIASVSRSSSAVMQFKVSKLDVADPEEAQQIIMLAESMAPVGGIFHLAMNLIDKLLPNQVQFSPLLVKVTIPQAATLSFPERPKQNSSLSPLCLIFQNNGGDSSSPYHCRLAIAGTRVWCPRLWVPSTWTSPPEACPTWSTSSPGLPLRPTLAMKVFVLLARSPSRLLAEPLSDC